MIAEFISEKKNNVVRKNHYRVFPGAMSEKFCRNMIAKIDKYFHVRII